MTSQPLGSSASADGVQIEFDAVSAGYGGVVALNAVSFQVPFGVCAILGPNGAGKTTMLSAAVGLKEFSGSIVVAGAKVTAGKPQRNVGYLPQQFTLAPTFRVLETVSYAAWCNGTARKDSEIFARHALDQVELQDKAHHRVSTLSGGERQRLGVACAIAHQPAILLLDEPTVGLDPAQRSRFREYLDRISQQVAVLLATHLLEDVQVVADRVVVLRQGDIVFEGTRDAMASLATDARSEYESPLENAYRRLIEGQN
ncbi:ABC transporter ATP-binding protein [Nocardioides aequoreus]|uniref:ABC transporter ATP-binding protein n=1 Tax=Nocardioides aequoreus TaxID=397278 RepID=UPI00068B21C2|nr:ATP-binding cassette domain-containing protein [Nocardioides aequoreus]